MHSLWASMSGPHSSSPRSTMHISRAFLVSGQAQHGLHFGFSPLFVALLSSVAMIGLPDWVSFLVAARERERARVSNTLKLVQGKWIGKACGPKLHARAQHACSSNSRAKWRGKLASCARSSPSRTFAAGELLSRSSATWRQIEPNQPDFRHLTGTLSLMMK